MRGCQCRATAFWYDGHSRLVLGVDRPAGGVEWSPAPAREVPRCRPRAFATTGWEIGCPRDLRPIPARAVRGPSNCLANTFSHVNTLPEIAVLPRARKPRTSP